MRVNSASKVTKRIIWTRCNERTGLSAYPLSAPRAGAGRRELLKLDKTIRSFLRPSTDLTAAKHGIMGGPVIVIEDVDKFNAVVSQEEARLRQLHPTPDDIPTCMSAFDNFLSCNSTPVPLSRLSAPRGQNKSKNKKSNSSRQPAQVDISLRRNGTLLDEMERVQVLHEHQRLAP